MSATMKPPPPHTHTHAPCTRRFFITVFLFTFSTLLFALQHCPPTLSMLSSPCPLSVFSQCTILLCRNRGGIIRYWLSTVPSCLLWHCSYVQSYFFFFLHMRLWHFPCSHDFVSWLWQSILCHNRLRKNFWKISRAKVKTKWGYLGWYKGYCYAISVKD